ncbi:uncharacterized protein VICG_01274 [Vittaforma corneae ATCC 50505]|uniref:Uncharacterized protein n=1 Tax=Vittaforma corneae (strain ATCC 50505) TaxID=993615 RepID=L2GLC5_VITCO|nr:uncharacterized protein VICG_01274 [Vittaforma corneae ATCC 50505]ELA41641.1 hypothetical protein VICG_01274 [Vittaforma corneae ATCC 50505]
MVTNKKFDPKDYEAAFLFNHFLNSCHRQQRFEMVEDYYNAEPFDYEMYCEDNREKYNRKAVVSRFKNEDSSNFLASHYRTDKKTKNLPKTSQALKIFTDSRSHSAPEGRLSFKNGAHQTLSILKHRPFFIVQGENSCAKKQKRTLKENDAQSYIKSQNVFDSSKIIYYNDIVDVINHNFTNCFVKREIASPKREESETETDCSSDLALHDNREYSLEDSNCSSGNEHENALSSEMAESKSKCPEDGTDNYRFDVQGITDTNILQKTDEAFKKVLFGTFKHLYKKICKSQYGQSTK